MAANERKKRSFGMNLVAGGGAGFCEALACHPLDTVKVRMQLKSSQRGAVKSGMVGTAKRIVVNEGFFALYKGLGAVTMGIVPKMAIRFSSFDIYKNLMTSKTSSGPSTAAVFFAGLFAGVTEAVMVVTPMDVLKIRMQAQRHSLADPMDIPKYRNAAHAAFVITKEEGVRAMYKGVTLTALRQATNQAVNFTVYQELKSFLARYQDVKQLPSYQTLLVGFVSGAMGPLANSPIDTVKTRIQKTPALPGETSWQQTSKVVRTILSTEGWRAFYKGLTPRVLRVAPGQAITFMVYEFIANNLESATLYQHKSAPAVVSAASSEDH